MRNAERARTDSRPRTRGPRSPQCPQLTFAAAATAHAGAAAPAPRAALRHARTIPSASAVDDRLRQPLARARPRRRARAPSPPTRAASAPTNGRAPIATCIASASAKCRSARAHSPRTPASMPSSRDAEPLHVAARPTTTLRPAYGASALVELGRPARRRRARPQTSASSVDRDQPLRVARERVEARARRAPRTPRAPSSSRPSSSVHQRAASSARRAPRGTCAMKPRDRLLDLAQPALLAADVEHRLRVDVDGVLGLPALPDRERLLGEPLGLVEAPVELGPRAAEQRRPPLVQRPVQRRGEPRRRRDLDVGAGDVAQLEQVDDRPARALELELGIADRLGDPAQLGRDLQPLVHGLGPPERVVARVEAGGERERVAEPARERDRLLRQREPPARVARVVELEREPGEQPRAQRRVLVAERARAPPAAAPRRPPPRARAATSGPA